ncbi:WD repeat, SAM and U-box domain-containing protein 1 isoform X2 [Nematostella vectensis]|uniref:WD repeat, SAM and U-box domain-containing protein 1 isoform X2 n=1 Tax=Nematostella vectensis TaxID=45351 RepID=UPI002076D9AE|nr:WD repeat, SAM and U-box domain-containing protein 1 isoform X2 [Nematostella vectensis]
MANIKYVISRHTKDVTGCCFSANSRVLASCSGDKTARLWDVEKGTELAQSPLDGHNYHVNSCSVSPFGTLMATASTDSTLMLWNLETGECLAVLEGHTGAVRVCRFSPNSQFLISGSADETFIIWDVLLKKPVRCVDKLESSVTACAFTPDGLHIITGTSEGKLAIWEAQKGKFITQVEGHDMGVGACDFSPTFGSAVPGLSDTSGSAPQFLLASGGNDNLVRLWTIYTASAFSEECHIASRCVLDQHQSQVWDCCFSPNGKILASASGDKTVILWNPLNGVALHTITGHSRYVTCCSFSPDGKWLATASGDRTLRLWQLTLTENGELDTGAMAQQLPQDSKQPSVLQRGERKRLVTWTVEEVCTWLESIGLAQYSEVFRNNAIDGHELSNMTGNVLLTDLTIGPAGHRNKILRSIKDTKKEEIDDNIPDEYLCPISRDVMRDPVIAADGYSYERESIESWLQAGRLTSPMTNAPLRNSTLTPNRMLKNIIQRHFTQHLEQQV